MAVFDLSDEGLKKSERREHDAFMTPAPLVASIVTAIRAYVPNARRIVEPSCGDGEFVAAAKKAWPDAIIGGVDIRPEVKPSIEALGVVFFNQDFLTIPRDALSAVDLFLGNPPYSLLVEFLTHILEAMKPGAMLAFLLRINAQVGALETQAWWTTPLSNGLTPNRQIVDIRPIFPRPSFTGGSGTDMTEYGLFVFLKGFDNGGRFDPIRWDKPKPKRGRKKRQS